MFFFLEFLTENSYAVYVFHAPVVVGIGVTLSFLSAPILLKFLVLATGGVLLTFGMAGFLLRKLPLLRSVL